MVSFCYCHVSIAPLRAEAKDSVEMVSQMFFGETFELLEVDKQWRKVRSTEHGYEGWTDEKLLSILSAEELQIWSELKTPMYNDLLRLKGRLGDMKLT